ncbi:MAG: class E sortase [Acidimicrobiia bacterium]|nr:class E sortase [Acidimicrobiia bacterium]
MKRSLAVFGSLLLLAALLGVAPATGADTLDPAAYAPAAGRQPAGDPLQTLGFKTSHIQIPAIGLDTPILAGVDMSVINQGVAHWVGTARPGGEGNMVLAGHRTTYGAPFGDLDDLKPGDVVYVTDGSGIPVLYKVTTTAIVEPEDVWITYDSGSPILTMFACHPKGSARYRIVVIAERAASAPLL